jgi:hypothetical protein
MVRSIACVNASRLMRCTASPMAMSSSWAVRGPAISAIPVCVAGRVRTELRR